MEKMLSNQNFRRIRNLSKDLGNPQTENEANHSKEITLADELCRKYSREGRFHDEILKAGE